MNSAKHTNLNVHALIETKLVEFSERHHNTTIRHHKLSTTWIPSKHLDEFVDKLSNANYVTHVIFGAVLFSNHDTMGQFIITPGGIGSGEVWYVNKTDMDTINKITSEVADNSKKLDIRWITDGDGNYYDIVEIFNQKVTDSLYPYIVGGVDNYINKFLESKSSILILKGDAGLGKTGFIREILSRMNKKAYVTYNQQVFNGDDAFADFISSKTTGAFVIEDADLLLASRESGNEVCMKLLNIGDGIISMGSKKLIFSTNLASTKDIDPALLRKGRCYDILEFRELTLEESNIICQDYDMEKLTEDKKYTLASVFNRGAVKAQRKTGFY